MSICFANPYWEIFCPIDSCSLLYSVGSNPQKLVSTFFLEIFSVPWEQLRARRVSRGVTALLVTSHGGCRSVCAQDRWGLQCWHLVCTCMEVSDPARVLFIHTWDRACEPHDLFCRNMMVKIGHLKWCWFFLSSNDATSSKILLQKIYSQEGIFRSTDLTLLFKLWLLFIVWLVAKS